MSHSTRSSAEDEASGREVYCRECEEMTTLGVEDASFGHEFGTEHIFHVVCSVCGGDDYYNRGLCRFAVKLPSNRFACDMEGEDICECEDNDHCSGWEG